MNARITISKNVPVAEVCGLYREAGWFGDGDDAEHLLRKILDHSFAAVTAADDAGHIIGFARALSDGVSDAYILDVVVTQSARKQGVASAMLRDLTAHLASFGIDWIVCIGVPGTEKLYANASGKPMEGHTPFRFFVNPQ